MLFRHIDWTLAISLFLFVTGVSVLYVNISSLPKSYNIVPALNSFHIDISDPSNYVLGPPTDAFVDNLRNDTFYVTTWSGGGFTNQFMAMVNLIFLGQISDRIPIIPPFFPNSHISRSATHLDFGDVFNMTHFRVATRIPVLEWRDVKKPPTPEIPFSDSEVEHLGCWTTTPEERNAVRTEHVFTHLGLDVSYSRVPRWTRYASDQKELFFSSYAMGSLIFPGEKTNGYKLIAESPLKSTLPPDTHLSCFDMLYYISTAHKRYEWETVWCPEWRFYGKYLKFTEPLVDLSKSYLRRAFISDIIPPFIAVHMRHGDFEPGCSDKENVSTKCFPSISAYSRHVKEIQDELLAKKGISVTEVLVSSDEVVPQFWLDIKEVGWRYINHTEEMTVEKYGDWYPILVDVISHSQADGFVGVKSSTFSLVSQKRVEDWRHGPTGLIDRNEH